MAAKTSTPVETLEAESKKFWNNEMEAIIGIMFVLIILGTINVFSASFIKADLEQGTPYHYLWRQGANLAVGLVAFIICFRCDYRLWRRYTPFILAFTMLSLILVLLIGPEVNGAKRWLGYGALRFQPAEIAKLVAIMIAAAYLARQVRHNLEIKIFTPQMGLIAVMFALTEIEPDMGTACIILGVPLIMLIVAGLDRQKVYMMSGAALVGAIAMILRNPYRLNRLKIVLDPWSDAQNYGYQTVQSLSAIGSGELTGMGLGVGMSKYEYLPEAHTDFAFAIFCQENGFLGAIFVLLLFAALAVYATRIAAKARDEFGQMLSIGIMILIVGQAIGNLLMVGGMFPVVGIPLPFISYGGTSLIVTMAAMGILANIGRLGNND